MTASEPVFDCVQEAALVRHLAGVWDLVPDRNRNELRPLDVQHLAAVERKLIQAGRWVAGPSSLFEVLGLVLDEVRNCRVLRWLLDPLAPHRLGFSILSAFLDDIGSRCPQLDPPVFPRAEEVVVVAEEQRGDTRADLVIYGPAWRIVVEAKILAAEQDRQGHRLVEHWPGSTYVFLTLTGKEMMTAPQDTPWVTCSWRDLLAHVDVVSARAPLARDEREGQARAAIADYLSATRRLRT